MFVEEKREGEVVQVKLPDWRQWCLDAAQYIRDHGWCQGKERDENGHVCMVGALRRTSPFDDRLKEPWEYINAAFNRFLFGRNPNAFSVMFISYNDACGRRPDEVIGALEAMAKE